MVKNKAFKNISTEDLEDIVIDEEVNKRYASIDWELLDKKEKEYKEYKEYIKKPLHPMSYEVDMEIRSAPQFGITDDYVMDMWSAYLMFCIGGMVFWYILGGLFLLYIATQ